MSTFADRLRTLRTKKKITQKEVADKLGISESAYGYYEQGRRQPPQESYGILAELFDVSLDYLILGSEHTIDEKLKDIMSDPYAMAMFSDFPNASEEDKKMWLEIWNSIKNRGKDKE